MKIIQALLSGIVGAIALSGLTVLFHWIFFRPTLGDGQYAFVFFVTVPLGVLLGALTSLSRSYLAQGHTEIAGRIALFGGGILTVLFLLCGLFVFSGTQNPNLWDRLEAVLFWFALPLLWAGVLLKAGLRLLAGR